MKMSLPCLAILGAVLLACAPNVRAQYQPGPPGPYAAWPYQDRPVGTFYLSGDIGGNILQSMSVKNAGVRASFEPGVRGDITFGYQALPPVALEFETGGIWNEFKTVNGLFLTSLGQRVDLYQVPFLANLVFQVPLGTIASLYFGGGGGGVASELNLRRFGDERDVNFRRQDSDTDFTYAYQGIAGIKFVVAPNTEVGFTYKFLGTGDHTWFKDDPILSTRTGEAFTHSFLASFTWRF